MPCTNRNEGGERSEGNEALQLHRVLRGQPADQMSLREAEKPSSGRGMRILWQHKHCTESTCCLMGMDNQSITQHTEQPQGSNPHQENPSSCHHPQRHGESSQKDFMELNQAWPDTTLINHWVSSLRDRIKPKKKMGFFDCLVWGYAFLLPFQYLWSNFSYSIRLS